MPMPSPQNALIDTPRPSPTALRVALCCLAVLLLAAFVGAWWSREWSLFSLTPPGSTVADIAVTQRFDLHITFFTIWAALLLVMPALALLPWRGVSTRAGSWWLAFWTVGLVAFLVHFRWAVWVIFGGDWERILHTPRVSAPVLDTVFAVWWCVDVVLAWLWRSEAVWVRVQRGLVHVLAFVLFFMGAAREGELLLSHLLGWTLGVVVALSLMGRVWWTWRACRTA